MKVIIAGSRTIFGSNGLVAVEEAVRRSGFEITEVVSGMAKGVDTLGEEWANERGIPIKGKPANWEKFGRAAGPIRNGEMALYADALIAVWDGKSAGTRDMISQMKRNKKPVFVYNVNSEDNPDMTSLFNFGE